MFTTACPKCLSRYDVPDDTVGKRTKCRQCGDVFTIPGNADTATIQIGKESTTLPPIQTQFSPAPPRGKRPWLVPSLLATILAVLVGGGGYVLWERGQDRKATAAYQEYKTLCRQYGEAFDARGVAIRGQYAAENADGTVPPQNAAKHAEITKSKGEIEAELNQLAVKAFEIEMAWERRWAKLGLPVDPKMPRG